MWNLHIPVAQNMNGENWIIQKVKGHDDRVASDDQEFFKFHKLGIEVELADMNTDLFHQTIFKVDKKSNKNCKHQ